MSFINGLAAAPGTQQALDTAAQWGADRMNRQPPMAPAGGQDLTGISPLQSTVDAAHPMTDPEHPFWDVMQSLTGAPGTGTIPEQGIPTQPVQGLEDGGAVSAGSPNGRPRYIVSGGVKEAMSAVGKTVGGLVGDAARDLQTRPKQVDDAAGYENGGPVPGTVIRNNYSSAVHAPGFETGPRTQAIPVGPNSGIIPASTEGQILTMEGGGPVPNAAVPDNFREASGSPQPAVSGAAAGFAAGLAPGQALGHNILDAWHAHEAREAVADAAGADTNVSDQNPQGGLDQPKMSLLDHAKQAVEDVFHHIHSGNLDDNGVPNGQQTPAGIPTAGAAPGTTGAAPAGAPPGSPVPTAPPGPGAVPPGAAPAAAAAPPPAAGAAPAAAAPAPGGAPAAGAAPVQQAATADAVKTAAADPKANAGIPEKSPAGSSQPHSLTPAYWQESDARISKAVAAAARAGMDPTQVYSSLTALRTSNIQGHVLKNLAAANTALLNGDEDSVRKALENVNYYLPNGQGMTFKNATAADAAKDPSVQPGQLMYRNPMFGLYGHQGEPEFTSVTPQHLQLLGTAALDPMNVQNTILKTYSAQATAQKEMLQAQGEANTGLGRLQWGAAQYMKENRENQMMTYRAKLIGSQIDYNEAHAGQADRSPLGSNGLPKITTSTLMGVQKQAADYVDSITQGQPVSQPVRDANGDLSLSPIAGHSARDMTRVPPVFQGLTPAQQENTKIFAGEIAAANLGRPGMDVTKAADLAARITRYQANPTKGVHMNPETKKPEKDVVIDRAKGVAHIWVGNGYEAVYLQANVAADNEQGMNTGGGPEGQTGEAAGGSDDSNPMQ